MSEVQFIQLKVPPTFCGAPLSDLSEEQSLQSEYPPTVCGEPFSEVSEGRSIHSSFHSISLRIVNVFL